ncbi:ROK family protein [Demequina sp.]|uniref:ROK family protein n=1 Tax=Demequina sp. TaxID=2050685 RepID=UPI003D12FBC6
MRLGVDIGGTKTDVVLVHAGAIVARHRTASGHGAEDVVRSATEAVNAVLADAGLGMDRVESIGIGVPGGVSDGVVTYALNLGLERLDLASALEDAWGQRPVIDNDVNVAALGAWALRGRTPSSLAYLNLGTGLAAGIILDGKLWRGARGTAGELGHISVDPAGPLDADGLPGALETYASGSGIVRQWGVQGAVARDVLTAAEAGDPRAVAIREGLYGGVAAAVRALVLMLDVEVIAIGGGLAAYGEPLLDGARGVLEEWARSSDFLESLAMPQRIELLDPEVPIAALGAADLGQGGNG